MKIVKVTGEDLRTFRAAARAVIDDGHDMVRVCAYDNGTVAVQNGEYGGWSVPMGSEDATSPRWYAHTAFCRSRAAYVFAQNTALAAREHPNAPEYQGSAHWSPERLHKGGDEYLSEGLLNCVCQRDTESFIIP